MERRASRSREIVLGLIALALLAGLAWALRDPGSLGLGGGGERFVVPYEAGRDLTAADRAVPVADQTLSVAVSPRPIRPLSTHTFRVRVQDGDRDVPIEDVSLAFNMEMDMGRHVYRPAPPDGSPGPWRADVVLPVCSWGGERWFVRVRYTVDGARRESVLLFDVPLAPAAE